MSKPLLQVESLSKRFADNVLFKNISFGISVGDKIGLIAKNGYGKTTLLNIITGIETYDEGSIVFCTGIKFGFLVQTPLYSDDLSIIEACLSSDNEIVNVIAEYEKIISSDNQKDLDKIIHKMDILNAWDYERRIKQILNQLKITKLNQKIRELSEGQIKRIALANVLISEPDLIILDEPTNHLDLDMVEWLEEYLTKSQINLLIVTHDRYFLDRVCSQIIEIDNKQIYKYNGNYSYFLEKREERITSQNSEIDKAKNLMKKELDWMRRQPQARATKSKSRIDAFYKIESKIKSSSTKDDNLKLTNKDIYIGNKIFEAKNISKKFGDIDIVSNFNYIFSKREKLGIIGNNGVGKSTFIKMLLGLISPDIGSFDIGETVKFGYYSQEGIKLKEDLKVIDVVQNITESIDIGNGQRITASQFLQHFLFSPEKQHDYVNKLSGGEKRRLYLCTILITDPNFLVLDEPTNDLDIITLNVLEKYLIDFKGCLIIISHDRFFMDKIVDHLFVFEGKGIIKEFPGNYTQYRQIKSLEDKSKSSDNKAQKINKEYNIKSKTKLTFNEKREFEKLEKDLANLEIEKKEIEEFMSSGELSPQDLIAKSNRIAEIIALIDEKTTRWFELSEFE